MKYLRFFMLLFVAASLCLASNCKKPTPAKPAVDLGFLQIDSVCKRYWAFKEGSYWVYENKKDGKNGVVGLLDTIACTYFEKRIIAFSTEYWKGTREKYIFYHDQINKDEYGNKQHFENIIEVLGDEHSSKQFVNNEWGVMRYKFKPYGGFSTYFIFPFTAAAQGNERFIKDTTINGHNYKDVIVMYTYPDDQLPDEIPNATLTFWAKDVGIIRYCNLSGAPPDHWDFQLKEYKLIKE